MARNTFLTREEFSSAEELLIPPAQLPDGNEKSGINFPCAFFSSWLGLRLEALFQRHPEWQEAAPIALGSWARGELCPKSDIDLLFCGDPKAVKALVSHFQESGFRIRHRMPEDEEDWTIGVEPFDCLAILNGKPFTPVAAEKLLRQQQKIRQERGKTFHPKLLRAMIDENKKRAERYDSISNYLAPNIKYGAGGVRDLQQALHIRDLFPHKFHEEHHVLKVLWHYKEFFLTVRQKLHLLGGQDVLEAHHQQELSDWFGFSHRQQFMLEIQKGLSRVSFYSRWVADVAKASKAKFQAVQMRPLLNASQCIEALEEDSGVLMQKWVRQNIDLVFAQRNSQNRKPVGKHLIRLLRPGKTESFWRSLFHSRLIDMLIPELRRLIGLVQHDQYHRYTADAHVLQCLVVLNRIVEKPSSLGRLKFLKNQMDDFSWQVLYWSCLYHDIGKGRQGDHSIVGKEIATKDLTEFGLPKKLINEVSWMVENHLQLTSSAFRKNPNSVDTWKNLHARGIFGKRLYRLALFSVVDIVATNPDAWNEWKQRLLADLVQQMEGGPAEKFIDFLNSLERSDVSVDQTFIDHLEPLLLEDIPHRILIEDMKRVQKTKKDLEPLVVGSGRDKWIRFHSHKDMPGLFVGFLLRISAIGASIRLASVQTFKSYGAYDWFRVSTGKSSGQIKKMLSLGLEPKDKNFNAKFEEIQIVSQGELECVFGFRGKDQSGALITAAQTLFDLGLQVNWASVHTWGRRLDDSIGVEPPEKPDEILEKLREKLLRHP